MARLFLWQLLMILLTVGLWLFWAIKLVSTGPREPLLKEEMKADGNA